MGDKALNGPQVAISTFDAEVATVETSTSIPTVTETSATGDDKVAVTETSATGDDEEAVTEISISSNWMLASERATFGVPC